MSEVSSSVWQQNKLGEWKLYFNTELEFNSSLTSLNQDHSKYKTNNNLSGKNLILGTLVMTPKGIGRLIKIKSNFATIRIENKEHEEQFPISYISNHFNCFITDFANGNTDIIRLKMRVSGKVEDIFTELEKLKRINRSDNNYYLIYKKNALKIEDTFEQLNLENNSKLLLSWKNKIVYTLSRYMNIRQYWFMQNLDGICFSPNQKIKLIGVGIYGSHDNKIIFGILKILDGPSITSKVILEQNVEIQTAISKIGAITKIYFSKPISCRQNQDYSIIITTKTNTNVFYGVNGKSYIEGEKGVGFSFKRVQGKSGGTGVETGNFPEIYYYMH